YPRYPGVISEFKASLDRFDTFLASRSLGILEPTQYELTYVNLIPKGDGWESLDQIGGLLPDFSWRNVSERFLPEPEQNQWNTTFLLPEQSGRLRVAIQKVI